MGVESAILMSAWGRTVSVGFGEGVVELGVPVVGVMDERKRGHSSIARESVLRRIGK